MRLALFMMALLLSITTVISSPALAKGGVVEYGDMDGFVYEIADKDILTNDPNHKGYYLDTLTAFNKNTKETKEKYIFERVGWISRKTECTYCNGLNSQYNRAMADLLWARHDVKHMELLASENAAKLLLQHQLSGSYIDKSYKETDGMGLAIVADAERVSKKHLASAKARVKKLEGITKELLAQLKDCEKVCKPAEEREIIIGDPVALGLPFDWNGPYSTDCYRCEKLAAHLNKLPSIAQPYLLSKANYETLIQERKIAMDMLQLNPNTVGPAGQDMYLEHEEKLKRLEKGLANVNRNLDEITSNFNQTLSMFNDCQKSCKPKKKACVVPDQKHEDITVGPNSEVGSGAARNEAIKGQAQGAAMGALGGLMGGNSGIGIGSAGSIGSPMGSSSSDDGPKTVKDPTSGPFTKASNGDTNLEIRASFDKDGNLNVSTKIKDSPGDGTFHLQWLEDSEGNVYLPVRYYLIQLWLKWKLTVSWTYDRFVDGELVEHKEGKEITTGREHIADFLIAIRDKEGYKDSIWYKLGFNTAKKGIKHMAASFNLPASITKRPCSLKLVTYITIPDGDPVIAKPVSVTLGGKDADVSVKDWGTDKAPETQLEPDTDLPDGSDIEEFNQDDKKSKKKKRKKKSSYNE